MNVADLLLGQKATGDADGAGIGFDRHRSTARHRCGPGLDRELLLGATTVSGFRVRFLRVRVDQCLRHTFSFFRYPLAGEEA